MPSLSRDALLVKYFAQAYRGIPRKYLVKFIYEADVLAREYLGHPVSTFTYRHDHFGPYDAAIDEAVEELIDGGFAIEQIERWVSSVGEPGRTHRLFDQRQPISFDFDLGEVAILHYVVKNYVDRMPFDEFMRDVIYQTEPWKARGPEGQPLPMDSVNHAGTRRVGFHLDEVVRAEEAAQRGEVVTLSAFMDELRAKTPA